MQSLIDAGEIAHALNAMYDKGVDHAIRTVQEILDDCDAEDSSVYTCEKIIDQLSKLKSNDSR